MELAKVIGKKEPHLISITLISGEPNKVAYEREEILDGKSRMVIYSGTFTERKVREDV